MAYPSAIKLNLFVTLIILFTLLKTYEILKIKI